jgi:hypothetical protein
LNELIAISGQLFIVVSVPHRQAPLEGRATAATPHNSKLLDSFMLLIHLLTFLNLSATIFYNLYDCSYELIFLSPNNKAVQKH